MLHEQKNKRQINDEVDRFIFRWHEFPIDYWWRKKYNVPFGSEQHRSMSFIDMLIEWREDLIMNKSTEDNTNDGVAEDENVVHLTQEQIDEEYDNINLEDFDK